MNTVTSICNEALLHLGMQPITDLEDDASLGNPSAVACLQCFETARDDVFSESQWPFATVQEELSVALQSGTEIEVVGWDFIYSYPTQAATVWNIYDEFYFQTKETQEFEVIYYPTGTKKIICCDLDNAFADYTYIVSDVTIWSRKFVVAFSYLLAAKIAHTLIGDPSIGIKMMEVYQGVIGEAKRIGSHEKRKKPNQESGYVNSR